MARQGLSLPTPRSADWKEWATAAVVKITEALNRTQKTDEEYEPVRLVLRDTVTNARYQITVASGVLTATAL